MTLPCVPSCRNTSGFGIWKTVPLIILMVLLYFCVRLCSPFLLVLWWTQSWFVQNTGAKQPIYLVNADDVGTLLAIEVQPLDNRKRKVLFSSYYNGSLTYVCQKWVNCYSGACIYYVTGFAWYATYPKKSLVQPNKELRISNRSMVEISNYYL